MDRISFVEAARRSRLSRQRLMDSAELSGLARAWKLWAVCNELTASYSKSADRVHVVTLANKAGIRADKASGLLRDFDRQGIFIWRKDQGSRSKGFLALPSFAEPDGEPRPAKPPKTSKPRCPDHPEVELWLNTGHREDSAYVAKIVNPDGSAWCCAECTRLAWEAQGRA